MSVYRMGGPNSQSEKSIDTRVKKLTKQLDKSTANITKILTEALNNPGTTRAYWEGVRRQLDVEYAKMYKTYVDWGKLNFSQVYTESLIQVNKQIKQMANVTNKAKKTVTELANSNASKMITDNLYKDALSSWLSALTKGKENVTRLTRITQQAVMSDGLLDAATAEAIKSGKLTNFTKILEQQSPAFKTLLNAVDEERYIQAGSRKYRPDYYAELVSRTKFHEAQSAASIQQAVNYGTDLVVVSTHNTQTEICQEFEGKIFSISGKDKRFPKLQERPPYHPNCLHLLFPQFESALEASGTLEGFSRFSKGKTNKPPYPAGFVPVDERAEETEE